jgi:hypothetical protein
MHSNAPRPARSNEPLEVSEDESPAPRRQSNPFGNDFAERIESDEDVIEQIFTIPRALELPPGYESVDHLREAMCRAWGVEWGNFETSTVDILLPDGWGVVESGKGRFMICGGYVGFRAAWDRAPDAKVKLVTRYGIEQKFDPKDSHCQLIAVDRQMDSKVIHWSYWYPQSGENHPQWDEMHAWISDYCPGWKDPLLHWDDCERNNERADRP